MSHPVMFALHDFTKPFVVKCDSSVGNRSYDGSVEMKAIFIGQNIQNQDWQKKKVLNTLNNRKLKP